MRQPSGGDWCRNEVTRITLKCTGSIKIHLPMKMTGSVVNKIKQMSDDDLRIAYIQALVRIDCLEQEIKDLKECLTNSGGGSQAIVNIHSQNKY